MPKKEKIKISIVIGISIALFYVFFLTSYITSKETPLMSEPNPIGKAYGVACLEVNQTKYESEIIRIITVYEFMEKLQEEGKINFKDKTYSGMGKFIEEINGVKNNGAKNWIYYVNGKKAQIGISNYKINKGDIVSWKYEKDY